MARYFGVFLLAASMGFCFAMAGTIMVSIFFEVNWTVAATQNAGLGLVIGALVALGAILRTGQNKP